MIEAEAVYVYAGTINLIAGTYSENAQGHFDAGCLTGQTNSHFCTAELSNLLLEDFCLRTGRNPTRPQSIGYFGYLILSYIGR